MKKARKPSQSYVLGRVKYWKTRLCLQEYQIGVAFGPDEDKDNDSDAECSAMPEYMQASLRFNLDAIAPDEIDHFVIHELLHIPTWRLTNFAKVMCVGDAVKLETLREHEELLTTYLERLVVALTEAK